ncbi:MAG: peptidylprolyl isomerase [Segetibacter sp.]
MNVSDDLQTRWWKLEAKLLERFEKKPDMEAVLFLIGMQETGFIQRKITKEQKQDLMHVAVCTLLSQSGYYILEGKDEEGWPHFRQLKEIPSLQLTEQENFLKDHVLLYFDKKRFLMYINFKKFWWLMFAVFISVSAFGQNVKLPVKKTSLQIRAGSKTNLLTGNELSKQTNAKERLVEISTDYGVMVAKLYDSTPLHRGNFIKLVEQKFYDSLLFHRLINQFMIQGGDPFSKNAADGVPLGRRSCSR